jgi:cell division inhibitor SepF
MALGDLWNRTLVYFGIAEEDDDWIEEEFSSEEAARPASSPSRERTRQNVSRLTPRTRSTTMDDWTSDAGAPPPPASTRSARSSSGSRSRPRPVAAVPSPGSVRMHLVLPRSFNDAQQIADRFKQSIPVILNLQSVDTELSKRLIDFASGLTYALDGGMQRVADKVFLLTPRNVEVSAEERARLLEGGAFFNQA